jgi:serine protease Do
MDNFKKLNGMVKAAGIVALTVVLTGALVLLAAEKSERGFLGVSVQRLAEEELEKLGLGHGVRVLDVEKDSAAAKAGIKEDDVLQTVNNEKVRDPRVLADIVRELAPGTAVKVGVWRGGKALELTAILGRTERPRRSFWNREMLPRILRSGAYLGVVLNDMNGDLAAYFGVKAGAGALIIDVQKATPAEKAGLKSGDVIVQLAEKAVKDSAGVHEILAGLKKGDSVAVTVIRHGKSETLKVEPDYDRHERIMRIFSGDKELEIDHLQLPEMNIQIPEIEFTAPCPPAVPEAAAPLEKISENSSI